MVVCQLTKSNLQPGDRKIPGKIDWFIILNASWRDVHIGLYLNSCSRNIKRHGHEGLYV